MLDKTDGFQAGQFVTARSDSGLVVQGAVISVDPLVLRGVSGTEYKCDAEGVAVVTNPPPECIGCDLPLGNMCVRCSAKMDSILAAMAELGPIRIEVA